MEAGRFNWRRYDSFKDRRLKTADNVDLGRSISELMIPVSTGAASVMSEVAGAPGSIAGGAATDMKAVRATIDNLTMALPNDVNGAIDYEKASALFREAYNAAPTNARAFRAVAMLLADSSRWRELDAFARAHTSKIPWDPAGWMTLALARQREGDSKGAAFAYDTAMAYADPVERARLDRLDRVLRPADTARTARATDAARDATAKLYWLFADPLWSREGNETRVEFLPESRTPNCAGRWTN